MLITVLYALNPQIFWIFYIRFSKLDLKFNQIANKQELKFDPDIVTHFLK